MYEVVVLETSKTELIIMASDILISTIFKKFSSSTFLNSYPCTVLITTVLPRFFP